jgi:hypothetical protein
MKKGESVENETTVDATPATISEITPEIKTEIQKIEPVKYELPDEAKEAIRQLQEEVSFLKGFAATVPAMKEKVEALEKEKQETEYKKIVSSVPGINPASVDDFAKLYPGLTVEKMAALIQEKPHFLKQSIPGVAGGGGSIERKMDVNNQEGLTPEKRKLIEKRIFG